MLPALTANGLTDAQVQLIAGHENTKSREVYQPLSLEPVDTAYQDAVRPSESDARDPQPGTFLWDFTYLCWNLTEVNGIQNRILVMHDKGRYQA